MKFCASPHFMWLLNQPYKYIGLVGRCSDMHASSWNLICPNMLHANTHTHRSLIRILYILDGNDRLHKWNDDEMRVRESWKKTTTNNSNHKIKVLMSINKIIIPFEESNNNSKNSKCTSEANIRDDQILCDSRMAFEWHSKWEANQPTLTQSTKRIRAYFKLRL